MFLRNKKITICAPCAGRVIPIEEVPDDVFSAKILGDGCGVEPFDNTVYAPVEGKITMVSDTGHAYAIMTKNNVEVLVHIGIDTVQLRGDGFTPMVTSGQQINRGDTLAKVDFQKIKQNGLSTVVVLAITPNATIKSVQRLCDSASSINDELLSITVQ